MNPFDLSLLIAGVLLLVAVLAGKVSSRLGVPALLVFILIGMAAGSEGLGGIYFDNAEIAWSIGTVALIFILFSGGLDTRWYSIRPVAKLGVSLAVVGTLATAALVGIFAHWALGVTLLEGMLLGAVVSSTDAAAVFGILRAQRLRLKHHLAPLLELESGSNDPTAVFLTLLATSAVVTGAVHTLDATLGFLWQMIAGGLLGFALGRAGVIFLNSLRLDVPGLYVAVTVSLALLAYGIPTLVGANGFLACYTCGLAMASQRMVQRVTLLQFHDGLAWLMQIAMFLTLGLLVFPSRLPQVAWPATLVALFLMFIARPLAVYLALAGSRKLSFNDRTFVGWVGLRGAVPIILATIPLTQGLEFGQTLFDTVFFVVLLSLIIQGPTLGWVAAKLRVIRVDPDIPVIEAQSPQSFEVTVQAGATAAEKRVVDLDLPPTCLLLLVVSNQGSAVPRGSTVLRVGDRITIATRRDDADTLRAIFEGKPS